MILLARHGQTEWNALGRKQGRLDSPLSHLGTLQAQALGRFLAEHESAIEVVFTSPLGRAFDTASIAVETAGIDPGRLVVEPLLIETSLGRWQGLTDREIEARYPGEIEARKRDKWLYRIENGGESYSDTADRSRQFLEWLGTPGSERRVRVIVTHEIVSRVLRGLLLELSSGETTALDHVQDRVYSIDYGVCREIVLDLPVSAPRSGFSQVDHSSSY